jgi:hypothetical protein
MSDLTIKFANDDARQHFVHWLDGQGIDCCYQIWMDAREYEGRHDNKPGCTGPITVLKFIRDKKDPSIIKTKCGRMDDSGSYD